MLLAPDSTEPTGLEGYLERVDSVRTLPVAGRVRQVVGTIVESAGPSASVGDLCVIQIDSEHSIRAEVVGFRENRVLLMPMGPMAGIKPRCQVRIVGGTLNVPFSEELLGRVVDGLGNPIDGRPAPRPSRRVRLDAAPPTALERRPIKEILTTGVRAIDSLLTLGLGQRVGVFAGSGVGKSTLMGMIARFSSSEVNVIGLIGERGREVQHFIEECLGEDGLARSVVVAATSDQPPLVRIKGAMLATALAEAFRDDGKNVCLMLDSVTRVAMAQREIGLAVGEPPTTRGYTPSVFAMLPKLLERTGSSPRGTITGVYTVLVEGDDMNEPVADTVRSILDGHVVLSRELAHQNHYPAIDVLASVSRLMNDLVEARHRAQAGDLRSILATCREARDLVNLGAYVAGSSPEIDRALAMKPAVDNFLRQETGERCSLDETLTAMRQLFGEAA